MKYHVNSNAYDDSYIKITVDAWKVAEVPEALEARLITVDEILSLGYELDTEATSESYVKTESTPSWVYNSNYCYWTSSSYADSTSDVWFIDNGGMLYGNNVGIYYVVRPVITLSKTVLVDDDENIIDDDTDKGNDKTNKVDCNNKASEIKSTVKVDNTYMRNSIITIIIGFIIASASIFILYKLRNKVK